jgi:transcriptional regulator with XRE-family HTH domain
MSRLERLRELRGLDPLQLARELGISKESYFHIELVEANWPDQISIQALRLLSRRLDVSPRTLLGNAEVISSPEVFVDRLKGYLSEKGLTGAEFSTAIGWDVEPSLLNPTEVGKMNASGFQAVCDALGLDWLTTLDEMQFDKK